MEQKLVCWDGKIHTVIVQQLLISVQVIRVRMEELAGLEEQISLATASVDIQEILVRLTLISV